MTSYDAQPEPSRTRAGRPKKELQPGLAGEVPVGLLAKQELIVTPAEPHIMAPLSKIKDLERASNTGWTSLLTFCGGAIVSAAPLALLAIGDVLHNPPRAPDGEAAYQLVIFLPACAIALLALFWVVRRLGRFGHMIDELQRGKRFLWNEATNTTTPLADRPTETKTPFLTRIWQEFRRG